MGCREPRMTATSVLRACGQAAGSPRGELDQSCARMSAPVAPPLARKSGVGPVLPLPCMAPARPARVPLAPVPFGLLPNAARVGPSGPPCVPAPTELDPGRNERVQLGSPRAVTGLARRHDRPVPFDLKIVKGGCRSPAVAGDAESGAEPRLLRASASSALRGGGAALGGPTAGAAEHRYLPGARAGAGPETPGGVGAAETLAHADGDAAARTHLARYGDARLVARREVADAAVLHRDGVARRAIAAAGLAHELDAPGPVVVGRLGESLRGEKGAGGEDEARQGLLHHRVGSLPVLWGQAFASPSCMRADAPSPIELTKIGPPGDSIAVRTALTSK